MDDVNRVRDLVKPAVLPHGIRRSLINGEKAD